MCLNNRCFQQTQNLLILSLSFRRTHKKISRETSKEKKNLDQKVKEKGKGINQFQKTVATLQVLEKEREQ